nr:DegV family protein [Anaerolinea sp.]
MKIVTDSAANLSPRQCDEMGVGLVQFRVTFNGKTYVDGTDITPEEIYRLYTEYPNEYPMTTLPSAGEFHAMFERYPNEEIIAIHLSSGLSGTFSAAKTAADMLPDGRVTVVDSLSIGPALGWLVEVAAHGARMGWAKERILAAVRYVRERSFTTASFMDIKYLVHSGRVSHLRGIIASMLKIKPVIGLDDRDGKFCSLGQDISLGRVIRKMVDLTHAKFGRDKIRLQLLHGHNLAGVGKLREAIGAVMDCAEDPLVTVTSVLGAHAGPTVFGLAAIRTVDF